MIRSSCSTMLGVEALVVLGVELGLFRGASLEVRVHHDGACDSVSRKNRKAREKILLEYGN
jgi:hypothetical protein